MTPLAGLTNLTELWLYNTGVSDLTPLVGLTNLTQLILSNNSISDLTPLVGLTSLTWLSLGENSVSDLTPLAGLTNLTWLPLSNNSISDLTPLVELTSLMGLELENNSISDLTPLTSLISLTTLKLSGNSISDLTPLAGLTNLTELRLENNNISDIAPLVENAGLGIGNWIDVRGNPLSDTSINTHIPALQAREVISDGDGGETPIAIPDAKLHAAIANELGKASNAPITASEMATLSHLFALDSDIRELTGLEYAINLTTLPLYNNHVSDLTPLAGLTNLIRLHLRRNSIADLTPLAGLTNLTTLYLHNNHVSDLTPLAGLTNLTELEIDSNEISELPVGVFTGFANLKTLDLARNPGAPFEFTLELERTDTANRLAPSPADVAVRLAEGAPFDITVALSVHNGSASVASLTISAGDTVSAPTRYGDQRLVSRDPCCFGPYSPDSKRVHGR